MKFRMQAVAVFNFMLILNFFRFITTGPRRARFPHSPMHLSCMQFFFYLKTIRRKIYREPLGIWSYRSIYLRLGTRKRCDKYTRMLQMNAPKANRDTFSTLISLEHWGVCSAQLTKCSLFNYLTMVDGFHFRVCFRF